MIAKLLSPIGRRETLLAATIIIVPTIALFCLTYFDEFTDPISAFGIGIVFLLLSSYYLSALFVGDRIVKSVLRHGDSLFGTALAWAIISHLLGVGIASLVVSLYATTSLAVLWETLSIILWYAEILIGLYALLPMIVAAIYYSKQLKKIKQSQQQLQSS